MISLDLDHFKDINDTLGHPVGDLLLRAVARRLRETVREHDIVARFGGDEFAVVATDLQDAMDVPAVTQRLIEALNAPFLIDGAEIRCGSSVGVALSDGGGADAETLLSHADIALYSAKADGRGSCRVFTEAMDRSVRERFNLGGDLRAAIEAGDLCLHYQPQVHSPTGAMIGLEALVRWNHPIRGLLPPGEFIPIAEQIGLAVSLGRWVLNEACRQTRAWLDKGLTLPRVAINLSGLQLRTPGEFEADLVSALARHGLAPQQLELELTETVLMESSMGHGETLLRLRQGGCHLAIDDFGTGYSSLDYLRRFRVDRIKIDRRFVKDLGAAAGAEAIVKATIGLAADLGVGVIAEGVETEAQRRLLQSLGCTDMQGYLFARPAPPLQITEWLRGDAG